MIVSHIPGCLPSGSQQSLALSGELQVWVLPGSSSTLGVQEVPTPMLALVIADLFPSMCLCLHMAFLGSIVTQHCLT